MDILILNNFSFFPSQPPLNTSYIVGLLRAKGFKTRQIDLSVELWDHFLSSEFLKKRELKIIDSSDSSCPFCPSITADEFDSLKGNVVQKIEEAKKALRDEKQFFDFDKLNWAIQTIFQAQQIIYYHYGVFLSGKTIYWPNIGTEITSLKDIHVLSEDKDRNPFIEAFEEKILPMIKQASPGLIGVDIVFPWEVIQAVSFNKIIKKNLPETHINFLGYGFDEFCFARIEKKLRINQKNFLGFDSLFLVRDDKALCELVSLKDRSLNELKKIDNLAYIKEEGVEINGPGEEGQIDFNIVPDYSDLTLNKYFAPSLVFIEKMSNKCFWSKCNFCSINAHKHRRQEADIQTFIDRLVWYKNQYGCDHIFMIDESVPPSLAIRFSEGLLERKVDIIWSLRTRIDKGFNYAILKKMHSAGCRELWIGLETISPRLLKLMNKTDAPEEYSKLAAELMRNCSEIGIGLHFCLIFNFPTETSEDRNALLKFFNDNSAYIKRQPFFVTFNTFCLMPGSVMSNNPEKFNISEIIDDENYFEMTSLPYITIPNDNPGDQNNIDGSVEGLTEVFVKDKSLRWLWFFASDSSYELLLKEHFRDSNPFRSKISLPSDISI